VFPGDDVTLPQVQCWMNELLAQQLVVTFEADYKEQPALFWFVTGWEHQKIEKPYLKFPQYPGKSISYNADDNDSASRQPFADHSPTVPQPFADHSPQVVECSGKERSVVEGREEAPAFADAAPPAESLSGSEDRQEPAATTKAAKSAPPKTSAIAADWQPADSTYALLESQGIDRHFAESCIAEFRLYWQERGERRPGWESTFVNNVKRQWERRPRTASPADGRLPPRFDKQTQVAAKTRSAIDEWLSADPAITVSVIQPLALENHHATH
jgi:hypothetical protein